MKCRIKSGLCCFFSFLIFMCSCKSREERHTNEESKDYAAKVAVDSVDKDVDDTSSLLISAIDLTSEYVQNEIKADRDYKGKTIAVFGIIADIKKGIGGDPYVVLVGSEKSRSVQCYYDNEDDVSTLKKGMKVYLKGNCDGLWVNVILNKCIRVGEFIR